MAMGVGERLGPFLLLERIGRGGMGEVWLAQPVSIPGVHDLCVVKTVRAEQADDPDALRRFADETRLAMLLNHPHISRVVDAGRAGSVRYLGLALVEGVDLLNLLKRLAERGRMLDELIALWIGACVLDALAFAHGARHPITKAPLGVVHRDISPQNVMCAKSGQAHVIDFGLALSSVKQARTEQDIVLGKLSYMAPEQARASPVDQRTDIYATGVILYELIGGRRYWNDLDHRAIWMKAGHEDWVPPHWDQLPLDVAAFLGPMLARDVRQRSTDAHERLEAIMPLLIARGGPGEATQRLAALVQELAQPELERAARAREQLARRLSPEDAPTEAVVVPTSQESNPPLTIAPDLPPDTQSLALDEAAAIAAALATPTIALPVAQNVGGWMKTEPMPELTPGSEPSRPSPPVPPPTMPFMMAAQTGRPAPAKKAPIVASAALALLAVGVAAAVIAWPADARGGADAGPAAVVDAPVAAPVDAGAAFRAAIDARDAGAAADAGATATALAADAGAGEGDGEADAGTVEVRRRTLDERLRTLVARCRGQCVAPLQRLGPLERKRGADRKAATTLVTNCERSCGLRSR